MKLTSTTYLLIFFFFYSITTFSQGNNCGDVEPVLQCPTDLTVCEMELLLPPVITTPSNLPDLEYAIVDYSIPSTSGTGPSVVGLDDDGIFKPSDFGIDTSTNFGVVPIAYDLMAIQETLDDVLKGTYTVIFLTFSCCDLAASTSGVAICDSLNNAGIFCGSDVTSLSQAAGLFATSSSSGDSLSVVDFVQQIDDLNTSLSDPNVPTSCGGGDKIAYAYGNECTYTNITDSLLLTITHTSNELIEASDVISSSSIINSSNIVEYNANICIELTAGFETIIGADFTAEIQDPCL